MTTAAAGTHTSDTDLLLELASSRLRLLQQLHALGERQIELIEQGDMTQLVHVLSAKQHLLAELTQVEKRLDPYRGQAPHQRQWRDESLRRRCASAVDQADELLRVILLQEKRAEARLEHHRNETARRLQLAHAAGNARTAYAPANQRAATLDLRTNE